MNPPSGVHPPSNTRRRDTLIAVGIGLLVLAFFLFATTTITTRMSGKGLTGTIISKTFTPQPETQITMGKQGLDSKRVAGQYTFEVRVPPDNKIYTVWVDKTVYDSRKVGDSFYFLRPLPSGPATGQ
jgi:hypothetical protein